MVKDNEIARKKIEEAEKIARLGRMQTGIGQGIPEIGVKSENGDHNVNKVD